MTKKSCTTFLLLVFCLLSVSLISKNAQSQNTCEVGTEETVLENSQVAIHVIATLTEDVGTLTVPLRFRRGDEQDGYFTLDSVIVDNWVIESNPGDVFDSINNVENFMYVSVIWFLTSLPAGSDTLFTMYFTTGDFWEPGKGVPIDTTTVYHEGVAEPTTFAFFLGPEQEYDTLDVDFEKGSLGPTWIREVESEGAQLPQEFALGQNYPNPFNPTTVIRFALPENGHVKLDVFNVLGQRVTTLVDEYLTAGYKETGWDGKDSKGAPVGSGIYLYRIWTEKFTEVRKMILLK